MLTAQRLRELLNYDPETGVFTWRAMKASAGGRSRRAGQAAGCIGFYGYFVISIDNKRYRSARLAWMFMTGEESKKEIDHIDGDRSNDRWCNLREASSSENKMNMAIRSDNTSGVKGVGWNKRLSKWHVRVKVRGIQYHIGYFDDLVAAKEAREAAALRHHGEFAKLSSRPINDLPI